MSAISLRRLGLIFAAFVVQTALLRAALPGPDEAPARLTLAGQLLVAAPEMGDPRFARAVILIVQHGPGGAFGIVVNNPIGERPLASVFKALGQDESGVAGSVRVFSGGPVEPEAGFVVHSPDYRRPETVAITDSLSITSSLAILQDIGGKKGPAKVLVAFGYAGWAPNQLEHEIEEHAWATTIADPALVFDEDRDKVWDIAWSRRSQHTYLETPNAGIEESALPQIPERP
jgi:putative transcriptional regulator